MGASVGAADGVSEGLVLGSTEGSTLGSTDGSALGEGSTEGSALGETDGSALGERLGAGSEDGATLGPVDGSAEGVGVTEGSGGVSGSLNKTGLPKPAASYGSPSPPSKAPKRKVLPPVTLALIIHACPGLRIREVATRTPSTSTKN